MTVAVVKQYLVLSGTDEKEAQEVAELFIMQWED